MIDQLLVSILAVVALPLAGLAISLVWLISSNRALERQISERR